MVSEEAWLGEIALSVAMSSHGRLGSGAGLGWLSSDLLRNVVELVREGSGIRRWKWARTCDDKSLVDFTTLRHLDHGTTVQLSHGRCTGVTFLASDTDDAHYACEGEIMRAHYASAPAIRLLQAGDGELVPHEGVSAGPWRIELLGPNLQITREDTPTQKILLTGDGFEMTPAIPAILEYLKLPPPAGFKVERREIRLVAQRSSNAGLR